MRERYLSSHSKLSILVFTVLITSAVFAKKKTEDTNIVCFAAQNKWICAPEDKQEIANKKAQKLLEKKKSGAVPANIVIKPINIPKFAPKKDPIVATQLISTEPVEKPPAHNISTQSPLRQSNDNPYAKLWAHQLIGVSTPNSAVNFVKNKHLNKNDILIIQSVRKGMDWWIVLYGLYKDKQTGLDNVKNLPKNINKPWLRPLKNLKVNGFIDDF